MMTDTKLTSQANGVKNSVSIALLIHRGDPRNSLAKNLRDLHSMAAACYMLNIPARKLETTLTVKSLSRLAVRDGGVCYDQACLVGMVLLEKLGS